MAEHWDSKMDPHLGRRWASLSEIQMDGTMAVHWEEHWARKMGRHWAKRWAPKLEMS